MSIKRKIKILKEIRSNMLNLLRKMNSRSLYAFEIKYCNNGCRNTDVGYMR